MTTATQATGEQQADRALLNHIVERMCSMLGTPDANKVRETILAVEQELVIEFGLPLAKEVAGLVQADRPRGLARLDSFGLNQLRLILLAELDRRPYYFDENDVVTEALANAERLAFADAIQAAIVAAAAPATGAKGGPQR